MAQAHYSTPRKPDVVLTLTDNEAAVLFRLLGNEAWPGKDDYFNTLNEIYHTLDNLMGDAAPDFNSVEWRAEG